jgi:NAD(P) transhydrogenase subunit alpha
MVRTRIPEASLVGLLAALATFCALEARGEQPYSIVGQSGPATAATGRRPLAERIKAADMVITTALIPGRAAPVLVTEDMVKSMKPGSVIVDMAAEQGGNCPLTEADRVVVKHGVTLVGYTNFPAMVANDSSALYARNVLDFLKLVFDKDGVFQINREDEIVAACLLTHAGQVQGR